MNDLDELFAAVAHQLIDRGQQVAVDAAARTRLPFDDWLVAGLNRFVDAHQEEYVAALAAKLKELLADFFTGHVTLEQLKAELKEV